MMQSETIAGLKKARRKVITHLIVFYLFLCLLYVGILFLFERLQIPVLPQFYFYFELEVMAESLLTLLVFLYASTGKSGARSMLNLIVFVEVLLCAVPLYLFFLQPDYILFEFTWFIFSILKAFCFYFLVGWMNRDVWADYFFTYYKYSVLAHPDYHRKEIEALQKKKLQKRLQENKSPIPARPEKSTATREYQRVPQIQPANSQELVEEEVYQDPTMLTSTIRSQGPLISQPEEEQSRQPEAETEPIISEKRHKTITCSALAIRLGAVIYGELIVFPIIIQTFQNFFVSFDNRYVFAMRWMFNNCLLSAFIWTWSIFFLYLNIKRKRLAISLTWLAQLAASGYMYFNLYQIYTGLTLYPLQVYLYVIVLDVVRLLFIFWALYPLYFKRYKIIEPD